ncbi:MAG: YdcH family protein [Halocynthiibacter sp.]
MTSAHEMNHEEVLRVKLGVLRNQHRDLDDAIHALQEKGTGDSFTLKRLKKQKLALKDRIRKIGDELTPDIIA